MFWLEARFELDWGYAVLAGSQYLSNRGEMRQHLPADYAHQPYIWLEASTSLDEAEMVTRYWLPANPAKPIPITDSFVQSAKIVFV